MFFHSWSDIGTVAVMAVTAYAALVILLRVSGKRTLAKLNAFDFVVTIAIGSVLASTLVAASVSWSEGVMAVAVLMATQFVIAKVIAQWDAARGAVRSRPTALVIEGEVLAERCRRERVSEAEVHQAIRAAGRASLAGVAAVVLEPDGSLSVIATDALGDATALRAVEGADALVAGSVAETPHPASRS